jgi:hypothetical protein
MPLLNNGQNSSQLADFQHAFMQQWSNGQVNEDWPPNVPGTITPDGLTQAALENCIGAAFFPGIEAGGIPQGTAKNILDLAFVEAFRLDQSQVAAGDATKAMARPWQGDFMLCSGPESQTAVDSDQTSWWPSARPIGIYPFDDPTNKRLWTLGVASSMADMVQNWHQLGFIIDKGLDRPVEAEKTNVCKSCFIISDRSEIGKDEAQALIDSGQSIQDAFYVVVQGLAPSDLGILSISPLNPPLAQVAPQLALTPVPSGMLVTVSDIAFENSSDIHQVQRITFGCNVAFTSTNAFTAEDVPITITATIAGLSGSAPIDLTLQQHPYMVDGTTSWLSADTRVFKLQPGGSFTIAGAQTTLQNDPNGFIKDLIDSLRTLAHSNVSTQVAQANSWFDALPPDEAGAQLEWSQMLNGAPVYNFGICRVRYRAEVNPATNVRAFFRLFPAMTTSTDYQPATTYRPGGQPGTKIPLLGIVGGEVVTIPFFAEPRRPATDNLNLQQDPKNIDTLPTNAQGNETYSFFGCWLDINQPNDKRFPIMPFPVDGGPFTGPEPLQSIADLIRGVHQCLVAEIAFDLDPIPTGATTANSDKLAQRNLSIDHSDNPGSIDTHRVQHTFTFRPTAVNPGPGKHPDELMIRWGTTPRGTVATFYLPDVSGSEIIRLADHLYSRHSLTLADPHTIRAEVRGGVTYLPIPSGTVGDLAGLLTVDLPATVRRDQTFRVVLHQVVDGPAARPRPLLSRPGVLAAQRERRSARLAAAAAARVSSAHHILGAFQFSILVRTRDEIRPGIERTLTNLQRVINTVPIENRWHPVLLRYLQQITARVRSLGGEQVPPPGGEKPRPQPPALLPSALAEVGPREARVEFEGKVAGIRFDRFGDFEGFILETEEGSHDFFSREREIETLVTKMWRERTVILVTAERHDEHKAQSIVLLRPPSGE